MLFSINEIAVWRWLFGWRWFLKILIKFILHVCAPHIMLDAVVVVSHIFLLPLSLFHIKAHEEGKRKFFSGIFNKEWGKFMLWKIIKNNYGAKKICFALHIVHPRHIRSDERPDIKYCAVSLQSNIYDINYRTFFAIIKKNLFLLRTAASRRRSPL